MRRYIIWLIAGGAYAASLWMVTGKLFGLLFTSLWNKEIDYDTDVVKVMLTTSTYVPNQDTHDYKDDVTNEVTGTGYTAGGETLASKTVTYTAGTNKHVLDAANTIWTPNTTITARIAVIYDSSPATDPTRPLIGYQDFITDKSSDNGDFTIQWDAAGIVEITVS
ncbi:hypothetical protein LCGC14_2218000 [marine sediment metagenome]|uniref:Uncharacterized protein n=1 Tax=marine sediment metagenome TaxID=412755 RepID=A0A0F9DBT1_9ZZZZ